MNREEIVKIFDSLISIKHCGVTGFDLSKNRTINNVKEDITLVRNYINTPTLDSNVEEVLTPKPMFVKARKIIDGMSKEDWHELAKKYPEILTHKHSTPTLDSDTKEALRRLGECVRNSDDERALNTIKQHISNLEQSVIEGNQNLQEKMSNVKTHIDNRLKEIIELKGHAIKTGNDEKHMKLLVEQLALGEVNRLLKEDK